MRLFILLANFVMKQEHDHRLINWLPQKLYSDKDQTGIQVKFIPGIFSRFYYYFDLLTYWQLVFASKRFGSTLIR